MKSYFQDPATMTDEELNVLSEELYEAYQCADADGFESWSDYEAEERHRELQTEIHRRFMLANPNWAPRQTEIERVVVTESLLMFGRMYPDFSNDYNLAGAKTGQTIQIRKPTRYFT